MKKRTSRVSRRIVSLLMSMVLTLTLVTPAAFATEVVDGSGTTIVEGNTNPADANLGGDNESKDDESKNTEDGKDEQPTNPGDEDKNPGESEGDANKPAEDNKGEEKPDEDKKAEENKDEQPTEDENDGEDEIALLNDNGNDVWGGADAEDGIDTSWYTDAEKDTGTTADKPYEISTAAQLAGLAQLVNSGINFSKKFIKLTADIKLNEQDVPTSGKPWTPIGSSNKTPFQGTFDGDGHTVSGVYINATTQFQGLFGFSKGIVKNLIVTGNITATNAGNIGGVVGINNNGNVINCGFYGGINKTPNKKNCGGVVGGGKAANVKNCWFYKTDGNVPESDVVGAKGSSNCAGITKKNSDLTTVNTNIDCNNKVWIWTEDKPYPVLGTPAKEITIEPIFADCAATVSVNGTELNADNKYTYKVTDDVTITASIEGIYYGSENAPTEITSGGVSYTGPFPAKLFYGTEDDFKTLAAWNTIANATITSAEQMKALARMVNSGKYDSTGQTISLGGDITLPSDWTSIGTENYPFGGTFNGRGKMISNLAGDLFGVVEGGTIRQVSIDAGRMVRLLKSSGDRGEGGLVEYCRAINVNKDTASIDSLVGEIESVTVKNSAGKDKTIVSSVSSSYVYDSKKPGIPVVEAKDELSTVTNCFYLAGDSTFGEAGDSGAREAEEFAAGRVTWELNGGKGSLGKSVTWGMEGNMPSPVGGITEKTVDGRVYELTLTKAYAPENTDIRLSGDGVTVFHNGDTWYAYCIGNSSNTLPTVTVDESGIGEDNVVTYGTNGKPEKFTYIVKRGDVTDTAQNTYYYTISKAAEADTNWYTGDGPYKLSDAADLFGFAKLVNEQGITFSGKTVELAADIDLTGYVWTPIGLKNSFAGTFDGGSHKVTGMSVQAKEIQRAGLFGEVSGMVRNVQVEGTINVTDAAAIHAGGIAGHVQTNGTVQNCLSMVNVYVELSGISLTYVGGVVGFSQGTVNLCWNKGNVQGTGGTTVYTSVGGVVGVGDAANCANFGEVTGNGSTGGIAGGGTVSNSYNLGDVTGAEGKTYGISYGKVANSY